MKDSNASKGRLLTEEEVEYVMYGPQNGCGPKANKYWSDFIFSGKHFSQFNKTEYERICNEENMTYGDWMEYAKDLVKDVVKRP